MKKIKFLNGMSAVFALAVVALATTFTSCEKEEFNVNVTPTPAKAVISPIVLAIESGVTTDVTAQATITPTELTFTGTPALAAKDVAVTAEYNGLSSTVTVKIPALEAGQFATYTPTIILQDKDAEIQIVSKETELDPVSVVGKELTWTNPSDYWYYLASFTYTQKEGNKVADEVYNKENDLVEQAAAESFFSALQTTYKEYSKATAADSYKVYANSMTTATVTYTTTTTEWQVVKMAGDAQVKELGSVNSDNYVTTLKVVENQDIPGHGHTHGHGHGQGNAGGGIANPD